jgi:DNA-binding LacI/PurR family transcriptional regulator
VWINTKQPKDCVHLDDLAAGHEAAVRLLRLGHRRIAWLDHANGALAHAAVVMLLKRMQAPGTSCRARAIPFTHAAAAICIAPG